jgi:hypothetical protein
MQKIKKIAKNKQKERFINKGINWFRLERLCPKLLQVLLENDISRAYFLIPVADPKRHQRKGIVLIIGNRLSQKDLRPGVLEIS